MCLDQRWRFLVMGCGSIGKRHIKNLLAAHAGHVMAHDVRGDRAADVSSQFGIRTFTDVHEAIAQKPNVAFVTAPTSMHVTLAILAAEHRCHLFIEKPLSHSSDEIPRLLKLAHSHGLLSLVGCNMRFHPGLIAVKQLLQAGTIGRVVAARAEVGQYLADWHPEEDYRQGYSAREELGGGVILDAIHEIDYIRWLLGPIERVACFADQLSHLEIETEDTAAILLQFACGAFGEVHLDYVQRAYSRTCHLIGDEGTIRWDYGAGEVRIYAARTKTWEVLRNPTDWQPNQMYVDELNHFLRCLAGEETPTLDIFEAARVLEVALAAKLSAKSKQVIMLAEAA